MPGFGNHRLQNECTIRIKTTENGRSKKLMKGNEVLAEAAIRCGCDAYYGYPITPQSEVMETLMLRKTVGGNRNGRIAGRK